MDYKKFLAIYKFEWGLLRYDTIRESIELDINMFTISANVETKISIMPQKERSSHLLLKPEGKPHISGLITLNTKGYIKIDIPVQENSVYTVESQRVLL